MRWEARLRSVCFGKRCLISPGKRPYRDSETGCVSRNRNIPDRRWGVRSLVDDLVTGRAVVLSRAATTLRSVEIQALIGRSVFIGPTTIRDGLSATRGLLLGGKLFELA